MENIVHFALTYGHFNTMGCESWELDGLPKRWFHQSSLEDWCTFLDPVLQNTSVDRCGVTVRSSKVKQIQDHFF